LQLVLPVYDLTVLAIIRYYSYITTSRLPPMLATAAAGRDISPVKARPKNTVTF
jgi:hypothetical protein